MAKKKEKTKELGFGTLTFENSQRFMNKDGMANIKRIGDSGYSLRDLYHQLTIMSWGHFFAWILILYLVSNAIFATLYYINGVEYLGVPANTPEWHKWLDAFFFSSQCLTTVGFGRINPQDITSNAIATIESLVGVLSFALATGLLFGRFSRPKQELLMSENILIAPYKSDEFAVMFRIAGARKNSILIENTINVSLGLNVTEQGHMRRRFFSLELELDKINFLSLSWTVVHPINEDSPLFGMSQEDLLKVKPEFIVLFKGFEETTTQAVYSKFSYDAEQIVWGAKFNTIIGVADNGQPAVNVAKISEFSKIDPFPNVIGIG